MAYASPGTDTSTDLDTDEKNQMVLTALFFQIKFCTCECLTNVDVKLFLHQTYKFDLCIFEISMFSCQE